MSYCLNPTCRHPENPANSQRCRACGSQLNKLRDRYHVTKALAQGGFGATFLAQDEGLPGEPICVIKQLRPTTTAPEVMKMARELFVREAKTLGKIGNHPQVPRLLDYFEENQQFYLVQEYINGSTLQQEVKRSGPLTEVGARQFLDDILTTLKYIHERQVIHRDIKPANLIRRSEDGKLVLIDFGAVKNQVNQISPSQTGQTALTAFSIGTSGFAPPEQIALRPVYASDIYAVGVTCIYLLTGKAPKDLDYNPSTGEMLWEQEVKVSPHLMKVLKKMLEASVRHRYQSADEAKRALEMESYVDEMANAMAARPSASRANSSHQASSNGSTSVASVAAAIRARRNKSAETTNIQPEVARQPVVTKVAPLAQPGVARQPVVTKVAPVGAERTATTTKQTSKATVQVDTKSFLMAHVNGRRDFVGQDLRSLSLERSNLSGVNFHSSKLDKTNFQAANLFNSDFGQASLKQANLRDANLSKAYLSHADLSGADLRGADLSHAYLNHANLRGANLCGANLTGAKLTEEQLVQAKTNWLTVRPNGRRGLL